MQERLAHKPRLVLALSALALGCLGAPRERPVARVMQLPLTSVTGTLGARSLRGGEVTLPEADFRLSLPNSYRMRRGGPDDSLSTHTFDGNDPFVPSFSVRRPTGGDTESLGRNFGAAPNALVTRGELEGFQWAMEVRPGSVATVTIVDTLATTPAGNVFCSGYVDTTDDTPVGEWMIARCRSLEVTVRGG